MVWRVSHLFLLLFGRNQEAGFINGAECDGGELSGLISGLPRGAGGRLVGQEARDSDCCEWITILVDEYLVPCLASKVLLKLCVAVVFGLDVVFPDLFFVIDLLPLLARRVLFGRAMRGALRVSGSGELVE